jgi:6-phosphogluconolactonase
MDLIISGYGVKPEKTIRLYSVKDNSTDILWEDSVENASFVCKGDGYLFTVTEAADYAGIYLYRKLEYGYRLLDHRKLEGGSLCHITYSSKNKALFGACYETGTLFSIGVEEERFGELKFHEVQKGDAPACLTRAHCVLLNREETELIVINIALDRAYFYDIFEGWLSLKQILKMPEGIGPRHAILSKDEGFLYIITE